LIGAFVSAHYRVYGDKVTALSFLNGLLDHVQSDCLGTINEIFDGDAPHQPRGCFAQAWSVAEVLRVYRELSR
jgi:glycogen debranching enzyme